MLIHMGFSVVAIAERMGHETTDITFRYAHLLPNSQGAMADASTAQRTSENRENRWVSHLGAYNIRLAMYACRKREIAR